MKVVLNPKHFHIRAKPTDGSFWLTREKHLEPIIPVKDVTNDVLLYVPHHASLSTGLRTWAAPYRVPPISTTQRTVP